MTILFLCCCGILSAQTYHIGDVYTAPDGSRGIVYYIHPDGSGGWVVALIDASDGCAWGDATDVPGLTNQSPTYSLNLLNDTAGYANTQTLRAYQNSNPAYAAGKVDFTHGWVLPSPAQLRIFYAQLPFISTAITNAGGTAPTTDNYWSSAEDDYYSAWIVYFKYGNFNSVSKNNFCRVRAVRSFVYESAESEETCLWSTGDTTSSIAVTPTQTTTYSVIVSTEDGCGDTAQHTIVVNTPVTEVITQSVCESYEWNGQIYTESGDYTQTFTAANGCDSVVTLHLTIMRIPEVNIIVTADTICAGDSVTLQADAEQQLVFSIAVGSILCTDSSIVSPSEWPVAGKTAMGIVFYVDSTGEHGWAVHIQNQGSYMWASYGTDVVPLPNYSFARVALTDMDGYTNTQIIANNAYCPAVNAVDMAHGWYLPAIGQLNLLFAEMVTMNASLQVVGGTQFSMDSDFYYWSSTECGYNWSWYLHFNGILDYCAKTYKHIVRSVRNF
ncbi:MAG: DUF1566 domain-containing protein [Bacteroidales bacterium]|nr:DUF1566 domain-containing protein [Bacteroidales bacterium]